MGHQFDILVAPFGPWRCRDKMKFKTQLILCQCLVWIVVGTGCNTERATSDMEKLQGTWQLVYQELHGQKLPDEKAAEMFHGKGVFVADKFHYTAEIPGFDFKFAYTLNSTQQPKAIDLRSPDTAEQLFGIYRFKHDKLEICYSAAKRPTEFNAGTESHNVLIVLKKTESQDN